MKGILTAGVALCAVVRVCGETVAVDPARCNDLRFNVDRCVARIDGAVTGRVHFAANDGRVEIGSGARFLAIAGEGWQRREPLAFAAGGRNNALVISNGIFECGCSYRKTFARTTEGPKTDGVPFSGCPGCRIEFRGSSPRFLVTSARDSASAGPAWYAATFGEMIDHAANSWTTNFYPLTDPVALRYALPAGGYAAAPLQVTCGQILLLGGNARFEFDLSAFKWPKTCLEIPLAYDRTGFTGWNFRKYVNVEQLNRANAERLPVNVRGVRSRLALSEDGKTLKLVMPGSYATVTYREGIPAFRFEKDSYVMRNDATGGWSEDRHFEVTVPKRNFWMHYGAFPGMKPFRGPDALTLETDVAHPAEIALHLRSFPDGTTQRFKMSWQKRTRFETKLDPEKYYQLDTVEIYRGEWDGKPWKVKFLGLEGEFSSSEADAVTVEAETGNPFRLVREGRAERAELVLRNRCDERVKLTGTLEMKGFDGECHPLNVDVALSGGEVRRLPLPETRRKGVWRIGGTLAAGDRSTRPVDTRFAVIDFHRATPKQPKGTFRLGINYHMGRFTPEDRRLTVAALNACGAKLVRAGIGISMSSVQGNGPDEWNFSGADRNLEMLEDAGLAVDSSVFMIPQWAARPENRTNANWHVWAEGRPMPGLLERFCERLARRYGTRIDYYETGNEWDLGFTGTLDDAVEIQREVYSGIKRGCPEACVIMNGWAAPGNNPQVERSGHKDFHENFLRRAGDLFDVHPIHIHGGFASYANEIENMFFPMRVRAGVEKKPWYSNETAITSVWGERATAHTVWKKILYAWSMGSTDYIWYNLKGTGWNPKDAEQGYGLLTADYLPRDGYVAFAALATTVGGKQFRRTVFRKASRFVMEFADERETALCAWDETATETVQVPVKTDAKRAWQVDLLGNRSSVAVRNGHATLAFGSQPAALVLEGASQVEPDEKALADIRPPNAKPILIPPHREGRPADFTLNRPEQVNDFYEANPAEIRRLWKGPQDQSARVWLVRENRGIRLLVEVEDDVQAQSCKNGEQYMGDDVQVAFASHLQNGYWELGLARRDDGESMVFCWISPTGFDAAAVTSRVTLKTARSGTRTHYDAFFPYDALGFDEKLPEQGFRFNLLVNDNDGDGRDAFIELQPNNFSSKSAGTYPFVKFER